MAGASSAAVAGSGIGVTATLKLSTPCTVTTSAL
jgi:hypothetical protein